MDNFQDAAAALAVYAFCLAVFFWGDIVSAAVLAARAFH